MSIGEAANLPIAAAVANAVEDVLGVRIKSLPITADKIYAALHDRNEAKSHDNDSQQPHFTVFAMLM